MRGWTLVEILITITLIGILASIGFSSTQTFSSEQKIDDGVNKVQSFIRSAQANATSSLKCGSTYSYNWSIVFKTDETNLDLNCKVSSTSLDTFVKTLPLPANINISSITGDGGPTCTTTFPTNPITLTYDTLIGRVTFLDQGLSANCNAATNNIVVTLRYTGSETAVTKTITISRGGGIDAQN